MSDFRMPDAWYEPPDEETRGTQVTCEDDCMLEDEHETCYTREDAIEDAAERRRDQEMDR